MKFERDMKDAGLSYKRYPILIVDDEQANLDLFVKEFGDTFTIFKAQSGAEALNFMENYTGIAVVVVDQRMPNMTGVELLNTIAGSHPEITKILITAYLEMDVLVEAVNTGRIYKYVPKPWDPDEIVDSLKKGIERYHNEAKRKDLFTYEMDIIKREIEKQKLSAMNILVNGLAHEINNPLVSVYSFLDMLPFKIKEIQDNMYDSSYWEEYYNVVEDNVKRIKGIINELFNLARPANFTFESADVIDVISEDVAAYQALAQQHGVTFQFLVNETIPPAMIDKDKIRQLLLNLIANGIQACRSGGVVTLSAEGPKTTGNNRFFSLEIRDNGTGIPEKERGRIFDLFYTTRNSGEGKGLGLPISQFIVREHGGSMSLETDGDGTVVRIQLPFYPVKKTLESRIEEIVKSYLDNGDEKDSKP